jgi:acyl-coenzyme A thioesterase PaaI-like protein
MIETFGQDYRMNRIEDKGIALQDRMHLKTCFGCGAENAHGLQLKTHWTGEEGICHFTPKPHMHAAPGTLNGGIISTLIDCHSISTAMAHLYQREGREFGSEPGIWCVTASLQVEFKRPTPMDGPVELRARVVSEDEARGRVTVSCVLSAADKERALGTVVAVRVRAKAEASK